MKVALIQLNPTVGALRANADKIIFAAREARAQGARLAIASELVVTGYPPKDLLDRPSFLADATDAGRRIVEHTPRDLVLIFGNIGNNPTEPARPLSNEAWVVVEGQLEARAVKRLLPTYDVFDEARHFSPGTSDTILTIDGVRVAVTICEDAWIESDALAHRYVVNPLAIVKPEAVDLLINLSASPFTLPKLSERPRLFASIAKRHDVPVVLVNQVGGNDEILFDGRSTAWNREGEVVARAKMFDEDLVVFELGQTGRIEPEAASEPEAAYRALVLGVRDYATKCGFDKAVLGLSGGIDSALTAVIAADALGPEHVIGVGMSTRYSSEGSRRDAADLAKNLGMAFHLVDIDPIFTAYLETIGGLLDGLAAPREGDTTLENIQARIRGAVLMAVSNRTGAIVLTTGNKSEVGVGYCTLYGDMVGGLAVISDVPKTMVYAISEWVNREHERIPRASIEKPPSAELRPDQKDEDSLPPYSVLDRILELYVEQHLAPRPIVERGFDPHVVARTLHLVRTAEYKRRQAAPGLIITSKAFGPGRRMPIAQKYGTE